MRRARLSGATGAARELKNSAMQLYEKLQSAGRGGGEGGTVQKKRKKKEESRGGGGMLGLVPENQLSI